MLFYIVIVFVITVIDITSFYLSDSLANLLYLPEEEPQEETIDGAVASSEEIAKEAEKFIFGGDKKDG